MTRPLLLQVMKMEEYADTTLCIATEEKDDADLSATRNH